MTVMQHNLVCWGFQVVCVCVRSTFSSQINVLLYKRVFLLTFVHLLAILLSTTWKKNSKIRFLKYYI
jgi:predicted neutral ceramidase superfamily lipid hydrolase